MGQFVAPVHLKLGAKHLDIHQLTTHLLYYRSESTEPFLGNILIKDIDLDMAIMVAERLERCFNLADIGIISCENNCFFHLVSFSSQRLLL